MSLPLLATLVMAVVVWLPSVEPGPPAAHARRLLVVAGAAAAVWGSGPAAALALAVATALHAPGSGTRTGAVWTGVAAAAHGAVALALATGRGELALALSLFAFALRGGVVPLQSGTTALAARAPAVLVELGATSVAAVLVHLRDVVPSAPSAAYGVAGPVVVAGGLAAALAALGSLRRHTLRDLWASSVSVHGAMLFAAVGASGRGHVAGAVFVAIAFALALGGFGLALVAIEARTGPIDLRVAGGRSQRFPKLAWAFAFFAAAGVAAPGTVGFAADDLLLHALWEESRAACGLVLSASAMLAIGLLRGWSLAFLGPAGRRWTAQDLSSREGAWVAVLVAVLVGFGVHPMGLLAPTLQFAGR